ncbi:MAG: nucleotidyltransferase domain-containing protein [Candidatus Odinarchaeota archaeon]
MSKHGSLSQDILEQLVRELMDDNTEGFILTGSHARNEATRYSDVDLVRFVQAMPADETERYLLRYVEGQLISISTMTVEDKELELSKPETAIWVVPALRQASILVDRTGRITELKQQAINFDWTSLQKAADKHASYELMGYAEEVHKILGGLLRKDESTVICGTTGLVLGISSMVAVQKGLLIKTENDFFQQLYDAVDSLSLWTRYHRMALGLEKYSRKTPIYVQRGTAALRLYMETASILKPVLKADHLDVVEVAISRIREAISENSNENC